MVVEEGSCEMESCVAEEWVRAERCEVMGTKADICQRRRGLQQR